MNSELLQIEYKSLRDEILRNIEEEVKIERNCIFIILYPLLTQVILSPQNLGRGEVLTLVFGCAIFLAFAYLFQMKIRKLHSTNYKIHNYLMIIEENLHVGEDKTGWERYLEFEYYRKGERLDVMARIRVIYLTMVVLSLYLCYLIYLFGAFNATP